MDSQTQLIADNVTVNASTSYSQETDIRKKKNLFLSSKITTSSTGKTFIEVSDSARAFWSPLPDFDLDIKGNTEYCVELTSNAAYLRQGVTLVGVGTFKTSLFNKD